MKPVKAPPPVMAPPPPPRKPPGKTIQSSPKGKYDDVDDVSSGVPVSDPNWQWSSYEMLEDKYGREEKRKIEAKPTEPDNGPFEVLYLRRRGILWPDMVEVTLFSTPLKKILQQFFPTNGDLYTVTKPKLSCRDLFVVLQALQNHLAQIPKSSESEPCEDHTNGNAAVACNVSLQSSNEGRPDVGYAESIVPDSIKGEDSEAKVGTSKKQSSSVKDEDRGARSIKGEDSEAKVGTSKKQSSSVKDEDRGALHLRHLVRFLETEYKEVIVRDRRMKEEKRVAWDMLWTFLSQGTRVAYHCDHTDELLCGVVSSNEYTASSGFISFKVYLVVWNFDGKTYKPCQIQRKIREFPQERDFAGLPVAPIEILGNVERLEAEFLANGRRFYELAVTSPNRYMLYSGPMYRVRSGQLLKTKSDGRVMIDLVSFASMNPSYSMGNARAPASSKYSDRDAPKSPYPVPPKKYDYSDTYEKYGGAIEFDRGEMEEAPDESLTFAPAIVYGFSFELKAWGCFALSGFSDIVFDTGAFEELTMDPGKKHLIHNLVGQYIGPPSDQDGSTPGSNLPARLARVDPIAKKGEGCIILCFGPPGTGKTLTAESIAEKMKQPLWALSVSELGTSPRDLEQRLVKVLEIAAKWRAVLLLDEADVYLEKRATGDVTRNAMTGVFLRLLEYYQGVLFLTTNRIKTFDDAFRSRISLFVHYPELTRASKARIWQTLLARGSVRGTSEAFCKEMAVEEMNGREIRNAIHMAQVWARSNGEVVDVSHVKHVTEIIVE